MSIGKVLAVGTVVTAMVAGASLYYLQVYAYYEELGPDGAEVLLTTLDGTQEPVLFENYRGIDSDSSPIRYRACFDMQLSQATLTETYEIYDQAEPLVAPRWFDCFEAREIGEALERGEAIAFLGQENIRYGIDRLVAVMPDGRGYSWNQINLCGEAVFNGAAAPQGCPPVPERLR